MTVRVAAPALDAPLTRAHPLTQFGFDALVAGAARPRPGALAFIDHHDGAREDVSHADLYQRIGACMTKLSAFDFRRGEKILICCAPGAQSFVALTAALAAGLDPVLAPPPLPMTRRAVAGAARALRVCALLSPAQFCGLDLGDAVRAIARETASIKMIGALHGALDDAADLTPETLARHAAPIVRLSDEWNADERAQIGALNEVGAIDFASQGALLAAALDLVRATRAGGEAPILSLMPPNSLGALIAGPLAALMAGAPLHYLAPFSSSRFVETLDALGPSRLVAPAVILPDLARAGLLSNGALISVTALSSGATPAPRMDAEGLCPIVELRVDGGVASLRGGARATDDAFADAQAF